MLIMLITETGTGHCRFARLRFFLSGSGSARLRVGSASARRTLASIGPLIAKLTWTLEVELISYRYTVFLYIYNCYAMVVRSVMVVGTHGPALVLETRHCQSATKKW